MPLDLPSAGTYRVFADFEPAGLGRGLTLGADVSVAGSFEPAPLPGVRGGGLGRRLRRSLSTASTVSERATRRRSRSRYRRDGREVTDLQPYLGAFGHLVSLRTGDLAYLHTHPAEEAHGDEPGGPTVRFATEFPTAGTYRLFLDFLVGDVVRTAEFTISAEEGS